jgi:hypothetical protein
MTDQRISELDHSAWSMFSFMGADREDASSTPTRVRVRAGYSST